MESENDLIANEISLVAYVIGRILSELGGVQLYGSMVWGEPKFLLSEGTVYLISDFDFIVSPKSGCLCGIDVGIVDTSCAGLKLIDIRSLRASVRCGCSKCISRSLESKHLSELSQTHGVPIERFNPNFSLSDDAKYAKRLPSNVSVAHVLMKYMSWLEGGSISKAQLLHEISKISCRENVSLRNGIIRERIKMTSIAKLNSSALDALSRLRRKRNIKQEIMRAIDFLSWFLEGHAKKYEVNKEAMELVRLLVADTKSEINSNSLWTGENESNNSMQGTRFSLRFASLQARP